MNNDTLIQQLKNLKRLEPKNEVLSRVESRVFAAVDAHVPIAPKAVRSPYVFSLNRNQLFSALAVLSLMLVLTSQIPRHTAYQYSISSLAETQRLTEGLEQSTSGIPEITASLSRTRDHYNSLSLDGTFGLYTMEQCRTAYVLYDSYLDYTSGLVDEKIKSVTDESARQQLDALKKTIVEYKAEAAERTKMYP